MRPSLFVRLLALILIVPAVELVLLAWIGEHVGFWPTSGLVVGTALAGSWLAKREGLAALGRFQAKVASGQLPGRELTDGLIILVAGVLLLTPGVLTDAAGLVALFPPTRAWIRRRVEARLRRSVAGGRVSLFTGGRPLGAPPPPAASPRPAPDFEDATIIEETDAATGSRRPGASP